MWTYRWFLVSHHLNHRWFLASHHLNLSVIPGVSPLNLTNQAVNLNCCLHSSCSKQGLNQVVASVCVCVWNICKDVKLHMSSTFVLRHATSWSIYFRSILNYTALWELSWNLTWWFKLLKVPVPICEQRFDVYHVFQVFTNTQGARNPWYVCPGQRRPDDMGVKTYLPFELLFKLWLFFVAYHTQFGIFRWFREGLLWPLLRFSVNQWSNQLRSFVVRFTAAIWCYSVCHSIFSCISPCWVFQFFTTWANQFFVTAIFRYGKVPCSYLLVDFYILTWHFSTCHSLVFSTSSSCRWWTTSQQLGPPHRSFILLFSFLVLKAVGFEQSVQSKDKIKSLQVVASVCVCVPSE